MPHSSSPIADQVAELRQGRPPTPAGERFAAEQRALALAGTPKAVLRVGSVFPDGDLVDAEGQATSLATVLDGAPGVVIFYRGAWCPYCNIALRTYREQLSTPLSGLGISLVAISPQKADGSMTMKEKHELDFAVLSDPGNQIAGALGILTRPSDDAREMQLSNGLDIELLNADGTTTVPMPTVALIDSAGILVWIDIHPDYTTRTEPAQVLDAIREHIPGA
jgi:peroxiredoxin